MIGSLLRLVSIACTAILVASFAMFVVDQARNGSQQQVARLAAGNDSSTAASNIDQADPSPAAERIREKKHGKVREAVDDADDVLVSPFSGVVSASSSIWLQRTVPFLLALLVFGVGLRFLASFLQRGRWR